MIGDWCERRGDAAIAHYALVAFPQRLEGGAHHVPAGGDQKRNAEYLEPLRFRRKFVEADDPRRMEAQVSVTAPQSNASPSGAPSV